MALPKSLNASGRSPVALCKALVVNVIGYSICLSQKFLMGELAVVVFPFLRNEQFFQNLKVHAWNVMGYRDACIQRSRCAFGHCRVLISGGAFDYLIIEQILALIRQRVIVQQS